MQSITSKNKPNMFPIDSLKKNMFFYFCNAAQANTVFSITAKPVDRTPSSDIHTENSRSQLALQLSLSTEQTITFQQACQFVTCTILTI